MTKVGTVPIFDKPATASILSTLRLYLRFNPYLSKHRARVAILITAGAASAVFSVLTPYLGKVMLDNGILARNASVFFTFLAASAAVYLIRLALEKFSALTRDRLARGIKADVGRRIFRKVGKLRLRAFASDPAGGGAITLNADINAASGVIANTLPDIAVAALRLILVSAVIAFIDIRILAIVAAYQIFAVARNRIFTRRSDQLSRAAYETARDISGSVNRIFSQIYFVKASGRMAGMLRSSFKVFIRSIRLDAAVSRLNVISSSVSELSDKIFFGLIGLFLTLGVIKGRLTLGEMGAVMMYLSQGASACSSIALLCQRAFICRLPLERVSDILDNEMEMSGSAGSPLVIFPGGRIEFRGVSFAYEAGRSVLKGISFKIPAGSKTALVGASGSGKTTIANLILRLYDVDGGGVFIDGIDVKNMRMASIYRQVSLAAQSPFIWSGSVNDNIACGLRSLSAADIEWALSLADAEGFVRSLPNGCDTILGGSIAPLSQGQKQRIAIARAVVTKPKILILDEACSSLDSGTEERVLGNISRALPRSTVIMISHRLSSVESMDGVCYLKNGCEMASGTHDELMAKEEGYERLFGSQAACKVSV